MKQLLSIEWLKIRKLNAVLIIVFIYLCLLPSWMYAMNLWFTQVNKAIPLFPSTKVLWSFPQVWRFVSYSASYFNILFAVIVVILTTNEFTNRTLRQHIIDGQSKQKVILSKFMVVLGFSVFVTLYTFLIGFVFGVSLSKSIDLYTNIHVIFLFFLQTLCYFGLAFMLAILIKKPALSIILYVGILFVETIVGFFIPSNVYAFFPMNIISKLTPLPFFNGIVRKMEKNGEHIVRLEMWQIACFAFGIMVLFYLVAFLRLRKKDL
jgi:ABC-2 type transport system permease protein